MFKLYGHPYSPANRVRWVLEASGTVYEEETPPLSGDLPFLFRKKIHAHQFDPLWPGLASFPRRQLLPENEPVASFGQIGFRRRYRPALPRLTA